MVSQPEAQHSNTAVTIAMKTQHKKIISLRVNEGAFYWAGSLCFGTRKCVMDALAVELPCLCEICSIVM